MGSPAVDSWDNAWIDQLAQFDEALRLGRPPTPPASNNPVLVKTQQFLERLQSAWPRPPKKIGPYALVRSLGQGGIGPSYHVEDPTTHAPLVLKILWPDMSADSQARPLFLQEAKAMQGWRHPGIAEVREVRGGGPLCVMVREYCPGMSLAQWRKNRPQPVAWDVAAAFIVQLADILQAAHAKGVCHGHFHPANVFLHANGEVTLANLHQAVVRITDFGLTEAIRQTRFAHAELGCPMPQYVAPEQHQHRSRSAEPASDLYGLGVMWYDLLTGRCPVRGTSREEIMAHSPQAPPPPQQYRPEIPADVETLVLRCLHHRPRERPASAQLLADALRALIPVTAPPVWWKKMLGWK